jgi:hypothetical protein
VEDKEGREEFETREDLVGEVVTEVEAESEDSTEVVCDTELLTVGDKEGNEELDTRGDFVGEDETDEEGDSEGY